MAQRELRQLNDAEKAQLQKAIIDVRTEIGFKIGDPITYELVDKAHKWCLSRFRYKSDGYVFDSIDFWNPLAFDWLMLDGYLEDDCDGYGYAILGFLFYVLNVKPNDLFRVSCLTETNEGHFIAWVKVDSGIIYQVENRVRQPRTVRYMRDLGYSYTDFSSMSPQHIKPNKWFKAEKKASEIIYNTPAGLESDRPNVSMESMVKNITTSETMQVGSGILGSGLGLSTLTGILTNLSGGTDWKIVALVGAYAILAAGAVWFIRARTNTALFTKQPKHLRADSDGFVG